MNLNQLTPAQLKNCKLINQALIDINLTNPYLRAGILAVVSKESGFKLIKESDYSTTSAARIYQVFGTAIFKGQNVDVLKKNPEAFFNTVYNRKDLGNIYPGDGWLFRGRSFNQLTGRANYTAVGKAIGVDLVSKPELLDDVNIAAKALAFFFRNSIVIGQSLGLFSKRFGITTTSQINSVELGAKIAHQANMGWARPVEQDPTGGYQVTISAAPSYLNL